jgi:hypothetical protein
MNVDSWRQRRTERPTLKVIEGGAGHGQPIDQPINLEHIIEQLHESGARLLTEFGQLRERVQRAERQAELALLAERTARQELDQLRTQLDGRQWSLWRRLRWALGRGR